MLIDRSAIRAPALPFEDLEVPEIGGVVRVSGLLLGDRLALLDGAKDVPAIEFMPSLLARTVQAGDGEPVYTVAEWRIFCAAEAAAGSRLFDVALRLNGIDLREQKKS